MEKIQWTKRKILQTVYWGIFVLMFVIAIVIFQQDGLWVDDYFGSEFYKLESATNQQRVFCAEDCVVTQEGFFPESEKIFILVQKADSEPIQWTLKRDGEKKLTVDNGETVYCGEYSIGDFHCNFYFDDWDEYMDKWMADYSGSVTSVSQRYASEGTIESFIRMAYGQKDNFGRYSLEIFIPWIILVLMAYVIGFHANVLFEWRKMWEFDYRNADLLEASDWYYFRSYAGAVVIWIIAFFIYLYIVGLI